MVIGVVTRLVIGKGCLCMGSSLLEGEIDPFSEPKPLLWCLNLQGLGQNMAFLSLSSSGLTHALFYSSKNFY